MRIAQLASNVERVPPDGYGGTELVVSLLTDELVRRGHDVTLFGTGDSVTAAKLVSVVDCPLRSAKEPVRRWQAYDIRLLLELQKRLDEFDIIHNHMGWQALPWLAQFGKPVVTTNHNPVKSYCAPIYLEYKHLPFVAISESYRRLNYPDELNYVATIYNGIEVERFSPGVDTSRSFLLFIGRLCEDKGTERAIQVARRLGLPIKLAGKVDSADQAYFNEHVKPHLHSPEVEFVGEVNHEQKVQLYKKAIATVYPINFEEPFGLVMAESLAAGTPVMAFDRGSVRELLTDETAVIGRTVDDLVKRFSDIASIDRSQCRQRVESLFSKRRMVDEYEQLYGRLL